MTRCKKHPRYRALRPPRADCETCRTIHAERLAASFVAAVFVPLFHPDAIKLPPDAYVSTAVEERQTPESDWQDSAGIAPVWEID